MKNKTKLSVQDFLEGFKNRDISFLSKAITYIESTREDHHKIAQELLETLLKENKMSLRIGISGTPGVGKSTFIEAFGSLLVDQGKTVAVLAVDPSSTITGGSILGDKTRMSYLSSHKSSFVRPSPSGASLGGVALKTREALLLCEAFGFDYIIVETVGVGQSEVTVSQFVDFYMLLMQPGSGDELQGIKRGILELANIVVVNKADGELLNKAKIAKMELNHALSILRFEDDEFSKKIFLTSALEKTGLDQVQEYLDSTYEKFKADGKIQKKRDEQVRGWFIDLTKNLLLDDFFKNNKTQSLLNSTIDSVKTSKISILKGAQALIDSYRDNK